jgi:hypothetical protein
MDEEQDLQAVAGKFVPHEDEIARQIEAEWKARLQRRDAIALLHRNHNHNKRSCGMGDKRP